MEQRSAKSVSEVYLLFALCFVFLQHTVLADCPMPDADFDNGEILYESEKDFNLTIAPETYVLRFECDRGYEKFGANIIACIRGKWSARVPRCVSMSCRQPPFLRHGTYELDKRGIVGSTVLYHCNAGYELENENTTTLTCVLVNNTARWEGELPICIEKTTCIEPEVSKHGYKQGDCCYTGDVMRYSCRRGYELVGPNRISCLPGGMWSADRPRCRPLSGHCPDPPKIANGRLKAAPSKGDYYTTYEEVEIVCDKGFAFYGIEQYVMCTENHEWDIEFGECVETFCPRPEMPGNGSIIELETNNQTEFSQHFELSYICDDGFRLIGKNYRTCDKGEWTERAPFCQAIKCPNPGSIENGYINENDFSVGKKVIFSCNQRYELLGSAERYCLSNGQWSGELTRCNRESNYCPNPGIPISGRKKGDNYDEGSVLNFSCHPGYNLIGSDTRQCLSNREWSGKEARCVGRYDFDNIANVGDKLKTVISEKAKEQADDLEKFESASSSLKATYGNGTIRRMSFQQNRILALNSPGRYIFYFIFDVSGSVKKHNFDISIRFAKTLVEKVGISPNGARAGALTFSSKASVEFSPVHYSTTEDVLEALDRINYTSGGTATTSALELVRKETLPLTREHLGRKGLKHVIFILTDGRANTGGSPEGEATLLKKNNNADIYCIGITGDVLKDSLYKIASEPTEEHVFILNNYKTLEWLVQEITNGSIDYSRCGLGLESVANQQRARVVNGNKAVEPWPWMAALYITDSRTEDHELKCGGSIIGQQWILTAAHCLCNVEDIVVRPTYQVRIKLGLTDIKNSTYLQNFEASEFFVHEAYSPSNHDYDIALIKLNGIVEYNAYVRPICLPHDVIPEDSPLYKAREPAFAAGWGHDETVRDGQIVAVRAQRNLKEIFVPLQSRERCLDSILDSGGTRNMFTDQMLCAGNGDGKGDTCVGDSGGPLMQSQLNKKKNVFWTQIGLVSWGRGCNQVNHYGFYVHVHKLLPWIKNIMKNGEW